MIIGTFNVKYSPNLGDGLLAECLEAELRAQDPGVRTEAFDLAGREAYGDGLRRRRLAMSVLESLPGGVRRLAVEALLSATVRRKLRPRWRGAMGALDAVVLGGGNLFSDADLNFPIKIHTALGEAARAKVPLAVFGVGVSDNWSARGAALFSEAIGRQPPAYVSVRDERSRKVLERRLPQLRGPIRVCHDPGVLAARTFPQPPRQSGARVAVCVTDPLALRYHGAGAVTEAALTQWFSELCSALSSAGLQVTVFTNGSPEDVAFLDRVRQRLARPGVDVAPAFAAPAELVAFIARQHLVISHRLHACIAAFAYDAPAVGLSWDPKLNSFFETIGRSEFVVDPQQASPIDVAAMAERALAEGLPSGLRDEVAAEAAAQVGELHQTLAASMGR